MNKCKGGCGTILGKDMPQMNGYCVDCFAEIWGIIVEKSPMVSPRILYGSIE